MVQLLKVTAVEGEDLVVENNAGDALKKTTVIVKQEWGRGQLNGAPHYPRATENLFNLLGSNQEKY